MSAPDVSGLKAGQRVRAVYENGTEVVGVLQPYYDHGLSISTSPNRRALVRMSDDTVPKGLAATPEVLPDPEPPVGTVVLDRYGVAWQRSGANWYVIGSPSLYPWSDVPHDGPPNILHTPDAS